MTIEASAGFVGVESFATGLRKFPLALRNKILLDAEKAVSAHLRNVIKAEAPADGFTSLNNRRYKTLRQNIRSRKLRRGGTAYNNGFTYGVGTGNAHWSRYLEFGTKQRRTKGVRTLKSGVTTTREAHSTGKITANNFFERGLDQTESVALQIFSTTAQRAFMVNLDELTKPFNELSGKNKRLLARSF